MGRIVEVQGEKVFIPRYRVTFKFSAFPTTREFVVDGREKDHLYGTSKDAATQAVRQAEALCAIEYMGRNVGETVLKVEREWESEKGWDELVTSQGATPGTKITVWSVSSNTDCFGVRPSFANITVGRWESQGNGTACLVDDRGTRMGMYERDDIFATW